MGREEMILILSLLLGKLGLANIGATKFDVEYAFHIGEYLLVWGGRSPLHICDHGLGCITLGREIFLGHLWLHFLPRGRDSVTNRLADRIGFDDVVGSIDLGEPLAFGVTDSSRSIASSILFLGSNNGTSSPCSIQLGSGLNSGRQIGGSAPTSAGADLDLLIINVAHLVRLEWVGRLENGWQ